MLSDQLETCKHGQVYARQVVDATAPQIDWRYTEGHRILSNLTSHIGQWTLRFQQISEDQSARMGIYPKTFHLSIKLDGGGPVPFLLDTDNFGDIRDSLPYILQMWDEIRELQ